MPTLVSPANGATNIAANPTLAWSASQANSFDVRFGTTNPPPVVATSVNGQTYATVTTPGTAFYWQIVAKNKQGSTTGPVWSFTTVAAAPPPPPPPATLTIKCPADQSATATQSTGIAVSYPVPTASGGTAPVSIVSVPPSGSNFTVGMTMVTATATDATQQKATCTFMVNVTGPSNT